MATAAQITGHLSIRQAARRLDLSEAYTRKLAHQGTLECLRTPLGMLVTEESVAKLEEERKSSVQAKGPGNTGPSANT